MLLFFYLFNFAVNSWHGKFVAADATAVFVNNQHGIRRRAQILIKVLFSISMGKIGILNTENIKISDE